MVGKIHVALRNVGFLVGVKGIRVFINGQVQETLQFGESLEKEAEPGEYAVHVELLGVVTRASNVLSIAVEDGQLVKVEGKYSRLWGNVKLKQVA